MYRIRFWGILQQNHNIKEPYGEVLVIIQALLSNLSHQPQTRTRRKTAKPEAQKSKWEFPKIGVPHFGVLIIRILLFRVLY